MKKIVSFLIAICISSTPLLAQLGVSCENPIRVDSNYVGRAEGACTLWYTAYTYDLPLNVHFIPDAEDSRVSPEIEVDFSCVPGQYDDPALDSLLTTVEDFGLSFPLEFRGNLITSSGKNEWQLSINESYREHLAEYGITYNLQAFVKVKYHESGTITFKPDTSFAHCVENTPYVKLGDTLEVSANDVETAYVFPFTDWQNDSIRFVWIGDQGARIYLAVSDCEFVVEDNNGFIWTNYDVIAGSPKKLYPSQIKEAIKENKSGGLYYAKVVAPSAGRLVVEKIPMSQAQGGAILMEKDKPIYLTAGDTSTLYCFPRTWKGTYFTSSSTSEIKMYTSPFYDFGIAQSNGAWRRIFVFDVENTHRSAYVSDNEMQLVTEKAIDDYIYVRFVCEAKTTIVAKDWEQSHCVSKSTLIRPNASFSVLARSSNTIYRLKYSDWNGYPITIKWGGSVTLPVYIADRCEFTLSPTNASVLQYASISRKSSFKIAASAVDNWASRVDEDGFIYVRFNPTNQGSVTFETEKPVVVTPDPVYTTLTDTVCYGVIYEWNDQKYTTSGEYSQTFTAANGADSVVTLTLVVLPELKPVVTEQTIEYGKSFEWNNKVYTQSTTDTVTLQNEHGCDYLAILKLTVLDKPASPCVLKSIELKINDQLTLNLDSAFTIYRINYSEWVAAGATLTWTGVEPLHTFVAETCEFAVAPYNKYVHAYVSVPAEGALAMTKAMLADMAEFVDEDGYLYVRFLTEQEGVLTVK